MRRILHRSIAAISTVAVLAGLAIAARRPRYAGTLRVEIAASMQTLEPGEGPLAGLVFETLVKLDDRGRPQPWLATSWTHDVAAKKWRFTPRPGVLLHDGSTWSPSESSLTFPDDQPIDRILAGLARPRNAVAVRTPEGTLVGTGPFAVARWEAGKSAALSAHGGYWGGKPYLEGIEITMARPLKEQALDLELGKADAIEVDVASVRRLRQQNANVAVSAPVEVLALVFDGTPAVPSQLAQALGLSIDRTAIQNVLLQRQGEVSAALLPQWLSGYSFVFPVMRDVARSRQMAAGTGAGTITIGYDRADTLARAIAERIAVNSVEAGIAVRSSADGAAQAHVVRLRITSSDARTALDDLAEQLKADPPLPSASLYSAERELLGNGRVIPLVHVPIAWQLSPKVHAWSGAGRWEMTDLQDTWMEP